LQPKSNLPPKQNMSPCPRCLRPRDSKDVVCPTCGIKSCPSGHIFNSRLCPQCMWEDHNFRPPARSNATAGAMNKSGEPIIHKIEYKCPLCGARVTDKYTRCPNRECNYLGPHMYSGVQNKAESFDSPPRHATPAATPQHSLPSAYNYPPPMHQSESSPLQDVASKNWLRQSKRPASDNMPAPEKARTKERKSWEYDPEENPKIKLSVVARALAIIVIITAGIFLAININFVQNALSALPKVDSPQPSSPKPAVTTTPAPAPSPLEINNIRAVEITDTSAVITWNSNKPSTAQVEYRTTDSDVKSKVEGSLATSHSVPLNELSPGIPYYYMVKSKDADGNPASSPSNGTFITKPDVTPPVISNDDKEPVFSDTAATITWKTDEKATSQIEYGGTVALGTNTPLDDNANKLDTIHSITISGLEPNKTYYYRVKSKDAGNNEAISKKTLSFVMPAPIPVGLEVGKRAPDFTAYTLDGAPITLSKLRGKIVMVNFWALGCGACMAEMPDFEAIYKIIRDNPKALTDTKELVMLPINAGDNEIYIKNAIAEEKWSMPIFVDTDRVAVKEYQINTIPRTFFIDSSGIIRKIERGRFDNQDAIKEALNYLQ
jgi:thiol-disulfide isomerase/thioredoxin